MKVRCGFISNSSSTSFMIKNLSDRTMGLYDFARETLYLVLDFKRQYDWPDTTVEDFMESVERHQEENGWMTWLPGQELICMFGDEDGTAVGRVYDYMLRDGGETKNFKWKFHESCR